MRYLKTANRHYRQWEQLEVLCMYLLDQYSQSLYNFKWNSHLMRSFLQILGWIHKIDKKETKLLLFILMFHISYKKTTILHSKWALLKSCCFFLILLRLIKNLSHDLKSPFLDIEITTFFTPYENSKKSEDFLWIFFLADPLY